MKQVWFAWFPVRTKQGRIALFRKVVRIWNPCQYVNWSGDFSGHAFCENVGGWDYHG